MMTLKEKLAHGDLDYALSRDEVREILDALENEQDCDELDDARDEAHNEGHSEGLAEGESAEFDRLKDAYIELRDELPEDKGVRLLEFIRLLDNMFGLRTDP